MGDVGVEAWCGGQSAGVTGADPRLGGFGGDANGGEEVLLVGVEARVEGALALDPDTQGVLPDGKTAYGVGSAPGTHVVAGAVVVALPVQVPRRVPPWIDRGQLSEVRWGGFALPGVLLGAVALAEQPHSGFVHGKCRQLFTGLGGTQIHGWVMFTSFDSSGVLARAASRCSW